MTRRPLAAEHPEKGCLAMPAAIPELFDTHEVAALLRQSLYATQKKLRTGEIPGIKLPGGRWRMKREDLQAILDGRGT